MELSKSRILVVDDNPRNVAILKKILGGAYRVATAASGEEAIQIAPRFAPDLTLLDIMMPGIDGYETCRRFRATPGLAHTKIIMVTAKALVSERIAGYEAGADDYMVKPFDQDELLAKVRVYLQLRSVEEVDRLKTDILTLLSHETRTPLTLLLSPLELVLRDETLSSQNRELVQTAQIGGRRLEEFVENAILLSRLYAGLVAFEPKRHDLAAVVRDSVTRVRPAAQAAGVELRETLTDGLETDCDAAQIQRVMTTLLDNAVRHSPASTAVEACLETREGYAHLSVRDQGPGISADFLPRVFDGFAVPDIAKHYRGNGLSLAIARAIVRCHEGTLTAESEEGGGAVFVMRLPLAGVGDEPTRAIPAVEPAAASDP